MANLFTDCGIVQYVMMQIIKQSEAATQIAAQGEGAVRSDQQIMTSSESVQAAGLMVATVPILVIYPFLQNNDLYLLLFQQYTFLL